MMKTIHLNTIDTALRHQKTRVPSMKCQNDEQILLMKWPHSGKNNKAIWSGSPPEKVIGTAYNHHYKRAQHAHDAQKQQKYGINSTLNLTVSYQYQL